jgi:hypothetical protein
MAARNVDFHAQPRSFGIDGEVVIYSRFVIAPRLIESPQALQILAKGNCVKNALVLPEEIPGPDFGEQLIQELVVGEFCVS